MPVLGYTISPARMAALLATPSGDPDYSIMGLIFEIKTPSGALNDIQIYPVFSDGANSIIDVGIHEGLVMETNGVYNVYNYAGATVEDHPNPTQPQLFLQLEKFAGNDSNIPYFTFFDAPSLQISVDQAEEFIVSGASLDTATLLGKYNGTYGNSVTPATLKIEVILPANYPHGTLGPGERKLPSYLVGLPCHTNWYISRN